MECDDQVLDLLQQEKCSQDVYEKEYLSYEKYEDRFIALKTEVNRIITKPLSNEDESSKNTHFTESVPQLHLPYLEQLRRQSVKNRQLKLLKVGEIVLLEDVNKKRTFWDLARVEKLIPGRDGQIRLAVVKIANSEFLRPVQRLFRLEMDSPMLSVADDSTSVVTRSVRLVKPPVRL
ncbi:integrase catalytic domain-containing protein [Trichonephila clavata]|uniref:Integrase catalytic domain-containing protein n=1 Tax=Trichonephila clavata TaxID=2740835 RepID=A0A8X6KV02_TRICU|nr:integrase catalytic domain-containing protein [Trichonephila clavata]